MNNNNEDTIVAIATPPGSGAIAVIRLSGKQSIKVANNLFYGKADLQNSASHTIHYGKIKTANSAYIDDVLVSVFRSPNSYTGEDCIEISCHGSQIISQRIISSLLEQDIRMAEPGEFTKRAFLNGKIDLAQAEAVVDLINSRTEAALKGARNQLDGILSAKIKYLRNSLLEISSIIELELDFAEEDIELITKKNIGEKINSLTKEIDLLLKSYSFGKIITDGLNVAIVGAPNVGKSSLLNYLLKESRAIVSEIPGTTRDIIHEDISIDGILYKLYDTAGIRLTENKIEIEGVERSRQVTREADLILFLFDSQQGFSKNLYEEIINLSNKERIITVLNKIDLKDDPNFIADVRISSLTGAGIQNLINLVRERSFGEFTYSENTAILTNVRHYSALEQTKTHLLEAGLSLKNNFSGEYIAADLRIAENCLNEIIGLITSDDILNNIFSKFCIGK
ncbi:MAG: tRNA uridine-5-carboxymethylaminomethyl(34) synthesis GTPase MnmE [Ignavibacteriales bacterium]|nr:tRNA uridine-5-carboxymethylaminomethyl(34) synthesis GTPase MnmE [Ignavibacteriales bacterium]